MFKYITYIGAHVFPGAVGIYLAHILYLVQIILYSRICSLILTLKYCTNIWYLPLFFFWWPLNFALSALSPFSFIFICCYCFFLLVFGGLILSIFLQSHSCFAHVAESWADPGNSSNTVISFHYKVKIRLARR